jgi:ADP-heptose:LPS heptosyltransferase
MFAPSPHPRAVPWTRGAPLRRVLVARLQAMGDLVITLPYVAALARALPQAEIDLLTREEVAAIPREVPAFRRVYALGGGRNSRVQRLHALALAPLLRRRRYELFLDLQNNEVTALARWLLQPPAWATFDKVSPRSAGERTQRTIEAAGIRLGALAYEVPLRSADLGLGPLRAGGATPDEAFVILNPAGCFPSRNWPLASYARFAQLWRERHPGRFLLLGTEGLSAKAAFLREQLGPSLVDLVGRTTAAEAFGLVRRARLVLTEDSGLMHMAWVSGVPTLALFGSSRSDWSAPQGPHTLCLHSGDLPCGACLDADCRYGDVHCLTRHTPEAIVAHAEALLARAQRAQPVLSA